MKFTKFGIVPAIGLAAALAACSGPDSDTDADTEGDATEETAAADDHDATAYAIDETGELTAEIGASALDPVNTRLAAYHAETGNDLHMLVANGDGGDVVAAAEAAMGAADADGMIYIDAQAQEIAVVGEGVENDEGADISAAMIERFDNDDIAGGMMAGVEGAISAMGN